MLRAITAITIFLLLFVSFAGLKSCKTEFDSNAIGIERKLSRMIGYTIVASSNVDRVLEDRRDFTKIIVLSDGTSFNLDEMMFLDPLPLSDVVVFAKPIPKELREKFKDLPERHLFLWKIAVNREIYSVTPR